MGWEHLKIAVDYDGDHHRTARGQFYRDIRRAETVANLGWTLIRITANDLEGEILHRVGTAFARRA
jgi:very-short-patch-repair endonuclease